jgi:hypothetical protein
MDNEFEPTDAGLAEIGVTRETARKVRDAYRKYDWEHFQASYKENCKKYFDLE